MAGPKAGPRRDRGGTIKSRKNCGGTAYPVWVIKIIKARRGVGGVGRAGWGHAAAKHCMPAVFVNGVWVFASDMEDIDSPQPGEDCS